MIFLSYPLIEWRWQNGERLEVITNVSFCLAANFCWQHLKSFKHNFGKGATFVIWGVQPVVHRWLITSGQKSCWTMFRITACRPWRANPLHEQMLTYCQSDRIKKLRWNYEWNSNFVIEENPTQNISCKITMALCRRKYFYAMTSPWMELQKCGNFLS